MAVPQSRRRSCYRVIRPIAGAILVRPLPRVGPPIIVPKTVKRNHRIQLWRKPIMRRTYTLAILLAAGSAMACWMSGATPAADAKEPMIGHMVYFQLTDTSPTAVGKMTAACDKYLKDHPGTA